MPEAPRQRVTLQTIADEAGVSKMTVSYALRRSPLVAAETRERVIEVAARLGYKPNPMIQSLMTHLRLGRPDQAKAALAIIYYGFDPGQAKFLHSLKALTAGIRIRAGAVGFSTDIFEVDDTEASCARASEILSSRGMYGALIFASTSHPRLHPALDLSQLAVSSYSFSLEHPRLHRAGVNHIHTMHLAGRALRERGYQRVGLAMPDFHDESQHFIQAAYHSFRLEWGLNNSAPPFLMKWGEFSRVSEWAIAERLDAVIAFWNDLANKLYRGPDKLPDDIGVVTFEWYPDCGMAGIDQNNEGIGEAMVDLVVDQLNHNERGIAAQHKQVLIEGAWRDGPSLPDRSK